MTDPSKERIAAALRLAEAVAKAAKNGCQFIGDPTDLDEVYRETKAYHATLPRIRSRAEVDAEIAKLTRQCVENEWAGDDDYAMWEAVTKLCREPTDSGPSSVDTLAKAELARRAQQKGRP